MNESFSPAEKMPNLEQLKETFEIALFELSEAARKVGEFETGRPDVDLGLADILIEKETAAREAFENLVALTIGQGEREGVERQQGNLPI